MTPEERAEGCFDAGTDPWKYGSQYVPNDLRERIVAAIREAEVAAEARERERCAKIAEDTFNEERLFEGVRNGDNILGAAIRATGTQGAA